MIKKLILLICLCLPFLGHAQAPSIATTLVTRPIVDFYSSDAAQRLTAGGTKIFSPAGTRSSYYSTAGMGQIIFSATDNSPGASGGTLYIRWSRDGVNTAYNDPGDGTGGTNYFTVSTTSLVVKGKYIPIQAPYVNFVFVQGGANQGSTYPQIAEMAIQFAPIGFSNVVEIPDTVKVRGPDDPVTTLDPPVMIGGLNSVGAPTASYPLVVDSSGRAAVSILSGGNTTGVRVEGELAHDAADTTTNNPIIGGARAVAHGSLPTAVAAADVTRLYANREGIPWVIAGSPGLVTIRANYTAAQTDTAIVTVSSGTKIVVTRCSVTADNANTVDVAARIGFGGTNTPTTTGVVLSHPGLAPGSGVIEGSGSGMLGVGGDGEDLRITSEVPTTGSIDVVCSYYTTAS